MLTPRTPQELAEALQAAASKGQTIALAGNGSKHRMAGPIEPSDVSISTVALRRVLQYEPNDLTISVEAGLPWSEFTSLIAQNRQMVPLDPPFAATATVGGVIAANSSGPRRKLYGTARDLAIGMHFATLEGKLVQSGGMVVKNVAGLDMAKLMIGSFGTLAAIAVVNFKLLPAPEAERNFLLQFKSAGEALKVRDQLQASPLQPAALDLVNPAAGEWLDCGGWCLAVRCSGSAAAMRRYESEMAHIAGWLAVETPVPEGLWAGIEGFTPGFLERNSDGAVVRASCTLKELEAVVTSLPGAVVARAASGVCYGYFEQAADAEAWCRGAASMGRKCVVEFAPEARKRTMELWPAPGGDVEIMRRVKHLFDPSNLLNRGRLYRRI